MTNAEDKNTSLGADALRTLCEAGTQMLRDKGFAGIAVTEVGVWGQRLDCFTTTNLVRLLESRQSAGSVGRGSSMPRFAKDGVLMVGEATPFSDWTVTLVDAESVSISAVEAIEQKADEITADVSRALEVVEKALFNDRLPALLAAQQRAQRKTDPLQVIAALADSPPGTAQLFD